MKSRVFLLIESAVVAALFFLAFAFGLSPLYRTFGWDNATFLYIGKAIAEGGLLPYVDISDNKGLLFLLIQAFGQWLSPGRTGIGFVLFFALWGSVYWMYRIALMRFSMCTSRSLVSLILLFYTISLADGNLTEDYTLPIVLCVYYYLLRHTNWCSLPIRSFQYSLWLGVSLGVCALLRLNNCVLLVPWLFYPFYTSGLNRVRWCLGVLVGVLLICTPLVVSFDSDVLIGSWRDSVLYNFIYVGGVGGDWNYWNVLSLIVLLLCVFLFLKDRTIRNQRSLILFLVFAHLLGFAVANMSKRYSHYQTLVIPLVLLGLVFWTEYLKRTISLPAFNRQLCRLVCVVSVVLMFVLFVRKSIFYRTIDEFASDSSIVVLEATIPHYERDCVAIFNIPIHYAYQADLITTSGYCYSHVQMASVSYSPYEESILQSLLSERTLWLVSSSTPDFTVRIGELVSKHFIPHSITADLIIWHRRGI